MKAPATTSLASDTAARVRLLCQARVRTATGTCRGEAGELHEVPAAEAAKLVKDGLAALVHGGTVTKSAGMVEVVELPGLLTLVKSADGRRAVSAIASTAAIDRMGDTIEPSGWKL